MKAESELGWTAQLGVDRMCKDLWRWQNANPNGYNKPEREFGAFKQAAFQKSAMPELSSGLREKPKRDKPERRDLRAAADSVDGSGGGGSGPASGTATPTITQAMRGRGTSMDDLLGNEDEPTPVDGGESF